MKTVFVTNYHHIDIYNFIFSVLGSIDADVEQMLPCTAAEARAAFMKAGWEGDGELGIIWLPPFLFEGGESWGACIWHVKQSNNGTSWLCARQVYDFPGLREFIGHEWQQIAIGKTPTHV